MHAGLKQVASQPPALKCPQVFNPPSIASHEEGDESGGVCVGGGGVYAVAAEDGGGGISSCDDHQRPWDAAGAGSELLVRRRWPGQARAECRRGVRVRLHAPRLGQHHVLVQLRVRGVWHAHHSRVAGVAVAVAPHRVLELLLGGDADGLQVQRRVPLLLAPLVMYCTSRGRLMVKLWTPEKAPFLERLACSYKEYCWDVNNFVPTLMR